MEEIVAAVKGMRNGKSSGADGISAEHLKHGGPGICAWLKIFFNSIITLESIPPSLNHSLICPIFKGKGRDPTNPGNYRGISLTSVIAKCLEKIILWRLLPALEENGFPHPAQTAYIKNRSCADGILPPMKSF